MSNGAMKDCRCAVHPHLWCLPGEPGDWSVEPQPSDRCECRQLAFDELQASDLYWVCFLEARAGIAGPLLRNKGELGNPWY